ncbi:hypothetical protein [Segatella copri]|uniref:hypothetical protein n=1 Tax=Segatella copri TaxID=165179 RepID=UPI0022DFCA53|nr:hypothetical protein [Segatella copri]
MEWLAQYAEFGLVNEQKLALVFVREVGAIDNATYRQLDSSITHARVRLEIHKLCDLGFLEKKGQGRNTYYIRTSKVVSLGERLRPQDERLLPQHGPLGERLRPQDETLLPQHGPLGERLRPQDETLLPQHGPLGERLRPQDETLLPQHGPLGERLRPQDETLLPQHGTLGEKIPPQGKMYHGKHGTLGERYQGEDERDQAYIGTFEEECMLKPCEELVRELPNELQERVNNIGNRASRETVCQLLIDLCAFKPYSYEELASILQRSPKALKDKYLKPLRLANKLFYWIPEMINHPLQKYVADPTMVRSNTKKK